MKVLVLNQGHTDNIGDVAINSVITESLKQANIKYESKPFWEEKLVYGKLLSNNIFCKMIMKIIVRFQFTIDLFNYLYVKKNINIKEYDSIIIGGGELLSGHMGFNSSLYVYSKIAKKNKIKFFLIGVSGDLNIPKNRFERNKKSLRCFSEIFVRDEYTNNIMKEKYNVNSTYYPDVVFSYNKIFNKYNNNIKKNDSVVIVPFLCTDSLLKKMDMKSVDDYYMYYYKLLCTNNLLHYKIIVTVTTKEDIDFSKELYEFLKKKNLNVLYVDYSSLENYLSLINNSKYIISGRMHSMILGYIYNNICFPIPFKEKLIYFQKDINEKNKDFFENKSYESIKCLINNIRK